MKAKSTRVSDQKLPSRCSSLSVWWTEGPLLETGRQEQHIWKEVLSLLWKGQFKVPGELYVDTPRWHWRIQGGQVREVRPEEKGSEITHLEDTAETMLTVQFPKENTWM